ncbi:MAG: hypothetical protein WA170_04115, partial [Candidatus Acidiferrales bacterium]
DGGRSGIYERGAGDQGNDEERNAFVRCEVLCAERSGTRARFLVRPEVAAGKREPTLRAF